MVGAHEAHVGIAEKRGAAHRGAQRGEEADRQVERAGRQRGGDILDVQARRFQPHAGGFALHPLDQRRQELDLAEVRHVEAERAGRGGRVEARAVGERRLEQRQRLPHRPGQLAGEGRRVHAARGAQEERVAEERPQPRERVGHRRLRQAQARRGGRDAALVQHGVEHPQQVEIDVLNIHGSDSYHERH